MAWTYEQKFNTLSDGDLNTQDSWTADVDYDIQTSVRYEGAKALTQTSSNGGAERTITAVSEGIVYFAMRADATMISSDDSSLDLRDAAGDVRAWVGFHSTTVKYGANGVFTTLFTPAANTWYVIELELNASAQYRLRYHNGTSWSTQTGWLAAYTGSGGDPVKIKISSGALGGTSWFDTITPTDPTIVVGSTRSPSGGVAYGAPMMY